MAIRSLVEEVYSCGGAFVASPNGEVGILGTIPQSVIEKVRNHKAEIHSMVFGDPLDTPGYDGRHILFNRAIKYVDELVDNKFGKEGLAKAVGAMCREDHIDAVNIAWSSGDWNRYREALKTYVKIGLAAAAGRYHPTQFVFKTPEYDRMVYDRMRNVHLELKLEDNNG